PMTQNTHDIDPGIRSDAIGLIEQNRERCLWFLSPGYVPASAEDMLRVLKYLQRYGTRDVYVKARNLAAALRADTG
ncbi:hypothetical protein JXA88_00050, partial [Candidatus Fermentibacteria bacterium]|nr:hypothetical protein [Candidatus Fermentibacteria bacterium]